MSEIPTLIASPFVAWRSIRAELADQAKQDWATHLLRGVAARRMLLFGRALVNDAFGLTFGKIRLIRYLVDDGRQRRSRQMSRVFITGSSDGIGLLAAKLLIEQGHSVVLHGRNPSRSGDALVSASGAEGAVTGDLSTVAGAKTVADEANKLGPFDAIIHNAGIGYRQPQRVETEPGVSNIFAVNVLAPYILTALIERPKRLIYVSSGMHQGVRPAMDDLLWTKRAWSGASAYSESKLCDVLLAFAVARRWRNTLSNAVEPGWVPTKMGGPSAPDDLMEGCVTQAWLATSEDAPARSTGGYFLSPASALAEPARERRGHSGATARGMWTRLWHRSRLTPIYVGAEGTRNIRPIRRSRPIAPNTFCFVRQV